jgi:hypothetical protein
MKRLFVPLIIAGLLTACAGVSAPGATKSQTPQQALTASAAAMNQLHSARFELNGTVSVTLPQQVVDQLRAKAGAQAGLLSTHMSVALKVSGAAQKPDQLDATISAKLGGLTLNTEIIALGGNLYYKDPMTSKWTMVKRPATAESTTPKNSTPKNPEVFFEALLGTAKSVTQVTENNPTINGVTVEHYRIVPNLARLFTQLSAGRSSASSAAMTALQTVLENATVSADVWTGKDDHLVRRVTYDADVTGDLSQLMAAMPAAKASTRAPAFSLPAGSIAHLTAHVVVDLHDFNATLTIQAPTVGS